MNPIKNWLSRHPFFKDLTWGFFEFGLTFLIFSWFETAIHEWIHLTVTQYFGGDGYIISTFFGAGVVFTTWPSHPQIVAFAGGIGVAILYGFIAFMDWHDDIESAAALIPLITSQLAYGIVEGLFIFNLTSSEFRELALNALAVGWVIGFAISIILLLRWLIALDKKYRKK